MKNLLFSLSLVVLFSCQSQTNKAIDYNNTLLEHHLFIANEMEQYLENLMDTSQTYKLDVMKEEVLNEIDKRIDSITKMEDFNGNSTFKNSVIAVFKAYAHGVKYDYEQVVDFEKLPNSEKTEEKKRQAEISAMLANQDISKAEDYFIQCQQEFAKENNFELD